MKIIAVNKRILMRFHDINQFSKLGQKTRGGKKKCEKEQILRKTLWWLSTSWILVFTRNRNPDKLKRSRAINILYSLTQLIVEDGKKKKTRTE